jgi:hypothetical protein
MSIAGAALWIFSGLTNLSPTELLNSENPIRKNLHGNFLSGSNSPSSKSSQLTNLVSSSISSVNSSVYRLVSELNSQITLDQSTTFVVILLPIIFLYYLQNLKSLQSVMAVYLGALLTQGYSGSLGVNFRFLNFGILLSLYLVLKDTNKVTLKAAEDHVP